MPEVVHCRVDSTLANRSQLSPDALALTDHYRKVTTSILSQTDEQMDELGNCTFMMLLRPQNTPPRISYLCILIAMDNRFEVRAILSIPCTLHLNE